MPFLSRLGSAAARAYGFLGGLLNVDQYFNYVTALLHGDGTNAAQNNTFLDSSTNNFTITRNGNTTQGSYTPFSLASWSNYFNGSTTYLTTSSTTLMDVTSSSQSFTIEAWIYPTSINASGPQNYRFTSILSKGVVYLSFGYTSTGVLRWYTYNGVENYINSNAGIIQTNIWQHVAIVSNAGAVTLYVNGTSVATGSLVAPNGGTGVSPKIGTGDTTYASDYFAGYISNLRTATSAIYTSNFTPSTTPLTAVASTSFLTAQSNRFIDNSTNAFTISLNGSPGIQNFSPFNPTNAYSTGSIGGSLYMDGAGDYLTAPASSAYSLSGDFTIECWVNTSTFSLDTYYRRVFTFGTDAANCLELLFFDGVGAVSTLSVYSNTLLINGTITVANGAWHHVAVCRSGTSLKLFVDGVQSGSTATTSQNFDAGATNGIYIGRYALAGGHFLGFMSDFRVVKGTALYTTAFTPPTAPLTAIANTQLLLSCTNGAIFDNSSTADYETVGDAKISTSVKKYGTGSIAFDGTGDYLDTPSNNAFTFGTGDFTIEFWLNTSSTGFNIMNPSTATGAGYWGLLVQTSNLRWNSAYNVTNLWLVDATPILNGQWNHVAICRTAGVTKAFFNGTVVATNADTTNYSGVAVWRIGSGNVASLNGYIDDFRITKYARYQYNFTPPTQAFPNIGGTVTPTADPYFNYTTLLLPGNGTNTAQNNTFTDGSTNNFTITRNGNTTQGTFSPFSQTGWSNYFDGSSYFSIPNINFSTNAFTIEGWFYMTTLAINTNIWGQDNGSGASPKFTLYINGSGQLTVDMGSAGTTQFPIAVATAAAGLVTYQWTHIALVRSDLTATGLKLYVNGNLIGTGQLGTNINTITAVFNVGYVGEAYGQKYSGYISNFRIVNGSAVYTSNFTPSATPLTAISNTVFLSCQSNIFVDNSSSPQTITLNGTPTIQAFSPYAPTGAYSTSTNGGGAYFDGSGDYVYTPSNANQDFGTNVTVECWAYLTSAASVSTLWQYGIESNYDIQARIFINTNRTVRLDLCVSPGGVGNYTTYTSTSTINLNAWNHYAFVKQGSSFVVYVNGVSYITATNSGSLVPNAGSKTFTIGACTNAGSQTTGLVNYATGYITNFRETNTAVYTGAFTPPTAPLTAISGTQVLLSCTNAAIIDNAGKNELETVGNAQISTTQSKYGGSSIYFPTAQGNRLVIPANAYYNFYTGDFTVEFWFYWAGSNGTNASPAHIIGDADPNFGTGSWSIEIAGATAGKTIQVNGNSNSQAIYTTSLSANTWYHLALSRYGTSVYCFINGQSLGVNTITSNQTLRNNFSNTVGTVYAGSHPSYPAYYFDGYIDDLRITKGIARYTSNFTPPTSAYLLQ